jgi:hypothetical protein
MRVGVRPRGALFFGVAGFSPLQNIAMQRVRRKTISEKFSRQSVFV